MKKVLAVRGMTCNHCKASVEGALGRLPGVRRVEVDLSSGEVRVDFDESRLGVESLRRAVEEVGYEVD
jgi:copper chaperone